MDSKFEQYTPILQALVGESIRCTPESWLHGTLTIECDGSYINYQLKNQDVTDKAQLSDDLRQLCEQLYVTMRQAGDVWQSAEVYFFQQAQEWSFRVQFNYPQAPAAESAATPAPENSADAAKPWWKFW
jgi:hypothetical protein